MFAYKIQGNKVEGGSQWVHEKKLQKELEFDLPRCSLLKWTVIIQRIFETFSRIKNSVHPQKRT